MITRKRLRRNIAQGRRAIEYSLLLSAIRPHVQCHGANDEVEELSDLLAQYNRLMARHERPISADTAAHDKPPQGDKCDD